MEEDSPDLTTIHQVKGSAKLFNWSPGHNVVISKCGMTVPAQAYKLNVDRMLTWSWYAYASIACYNIDLSG